MDDTLDGSLSRLEDSQVPADDTMEDSQSQWDTDSLAVASSVPHSADHVWNLHEGADSKIVVFVVALAVVTLVCCFQISWRYVYEI